MGQARDVEVHGVDLVVAAGGGGGRGGGGRLVAPPPPGPLPGPALGAAGKVRQGREVEEAWRAAEGGLRAWRGELTEICPTFVAGMSLLLKWSCQFSFKLVGWNE